MMKEKRFVTFTAVFTLCILFALTLPIKLHSYESDYIIQDCFDLIKDGKYGLSEEFFTLIENNSKTERQAYLKALQITMIEWLFCERQKLNYFTINTESQGSYDSRTPEKRLTNFFNNAWNLNKIEMNLANLSQYSYPSSRTYIDPNITSPQRGLSYQIRRENERKLELKKIKDEIRRGISITENNLKPYFYITGIASEHAEQAYKLLLYGNDFFQGLLVTSLSISEVDKEIEEQSMLLSMLKHSNSQSVMKREAGGDLSANRKENYKGMTDSINAERAYINEKEQKISELKNARLGMLNCYQTLYIPVDFDGKEKPLYKHISEIHTFNDTPSTHEVLEAENKSIELIKKAVEKTKQQSTEAIYYVMEMDFGDLPRLMHLKRLRDLIAVRSDNYFETIEDELLTEFKESEDSKAIVEYIGYAGGSIIALGGMLFPPLALVGSAIILGICTDNLIEAYIADRDSSCLTNASLLEGLYSITQAEAVSKKYSAAIAHEIVALSPLFLSCGQAGVLFKSKSYFQPRANAWEIVRVKRAINKGTLRRLNQGDAGTVYEHPYNLNKVVKVAHQSDDWFPKQWIMEAEAAKVAKVIGPKYNFKVSEIKVIGKTKDGRLIGIKERVHGKPLNELTVEDIGLTAYEEVMERYESIRKVLLTEKFKDPSLQNFMLADDGTLFMVDGAYPHF